jgi:hypothetical protein
VPLAIVSEDGRVDIAGNGYAFTSVQAGGAFERVWFDIHDADPTPVQAFAAKSGIAGVSFGALPQARWSAALDPLGTESGTPRGTIVIDGITADGFVESAIEELTWSFE